MISRKRYKMGKEVLPNARKADKRSTLKERKDTSSTGVKRSWKETFRSLFPQKKETVTEQKNSSSLDVIPPQKSKGIREKKKKDQVPSSQK